MKTKLGDKYSVMDLKKAVKILNDNNHNGETTYSMHKFKGTYIVEDELEDYKYTKFEAIAISKEYNVGD